MLTRHISPVALCAVLIAASGCSGRPGRLPPPGIPAEAGQEAVTKYDANGNGAIDGDELSKVPALKATLARVDKNGDGQVSAEEVDERIAAWQKSKLAITRSIVTVRRNGRPLAGATITIVPESFLGPSVKSATGITDATGSASLQISSNPDERGVHLGFYRVKVTKPDAGGKEQIPARFNSETTLGAEIIGDAVDMFTLDISGK